jgi:hypothetical protein
MKTARRTRPPKLVESFLALALIATVSPQLTGGTALAVAFTRDFRVEDCTWSSRGEDNPFLSLRPGYQLVLEGEEEDDGEVVHIEAVITVLHQKKRITFESAGGETISLKARVVEERESEDGELVEVSRNWFARCVETSDIYYFGEDVDDYEDGEIVSHDGEWIAGENDALPGIIMPGTFLLGAKYYQEIAPGVAMDRGRNVDMGLEVSTPAGTFTDCVAVIDSSFLDPEAEDLKIYCPDVGIVIDEDLALTGYRQVQP